jgi:hypothetical protein
VKEWVNGKLVTKWKIHALDTAAYPDFSWAAWGVNDHGQIVGVGGDNNNPQTTVVGALWNRRSDGEGWGKLECTPKMRHELKGQITLNGGEQCLCPDNSIPVN